MTIDLEVQQVYLDAIKSGEKTIEGRLAKPKYLGLKQGDNIQFINPDGTQSVIKKVITIHRYATFENAFREQDYRKAIPDAQSAKDAVMAYEKFYPKQVQEQLGVVFIELA